MKTRYRVTNHPESRTFDSMTDATVWALENLRDSAWRIEPVLDSDFPEIISELDSPG